MIILPFAARILCRVAEPSVLVADHGAHKPSVAGRAEHCKWSHDPPISAVVWLPVVDVVLAPVLLVDRAVAVAVHEAVHAQQLGLVRGHQAARPAPHHHAAPV